MIEIQPVAVLTRYSHHFTVSNIRKDAVRVATEGVYNQFAHWQFGRRDDGSFGRMIGKHFAVKMIGRHGDACYRFHINAWHTFCMALDGVGYGKDQFNIYEMPLYEPQPANLTFGFAHALREDQLAAHEYLMSAAPASKLVTAQTGTGKSVTATHALCAKAKRVLVIIRPMYIKKWIADLQNLCGIPKERIVVVSGDKYPGITVKPLQELLKCVTEDLPYDAIIISNKTIRRWLTKYIERGDKLLNEGYAITPVELCERLGTNGYLVDERHQDFHLQFLMDLFTHAPETIGLTATLISDDPFITKMQSILHPPHTRAKKAAYNVYARVSSFHYWFKNPDRIRLVQFGSTSYSHTAFEDSIARNPQVLKNYFDMVRLAVERYWNNNGKRVGDRCLIFFATIVMCSKFVAYLRAFYPHVNISRYCEGDPYENLIESDIAVSTVISAGTAHDIAQLTAVIMTNVMKSSSSNWQVLGRLRDLKDGRNPYFVYFVGEDFGKHIDYHMAKQELFLTEKLPLFSYGYNPRL